MTVYENLPVYKAAYDLLRSVYEKTGKIPRDVKYTLVEVLKKDLTERMASTIRHKRARGMYKIELMTRLVGELTRSDMSDAWICRNQGMDKEELLHLKQISGLADFFVDKGGG